MTQPGRERRAHPRYDLTCPAVLADRRGRELLRARTLNVSDGGTLLAPLDEAVGTGREVSKRRPVAAWSRRRLRLKLRVPRFTENTFMYEDFVAEARVVRLQPIQQGQAVALAFSAPLTLGLEV